MHLSSHKKRVQTWPVLKRSKTLLKTIEVRRSCSARQSASARSARLCSVASVFKMSVTLLGRSRSLLSKLGPLTVRTASPAVSNSTVLNPINQRDLTTTATAANSVNALAAETETDLTPQLREALQSVTPKLLIDGTFVDAKSGKLFYTEDPRTGKKIIDVAEAQKEDVELAVQAARRAFDKGPWPRMSGRERGRIMYKMADLMEEHLDELAMLESLDNGKPLAMSKAGDVPLSVEHLRYYAGYADKIYGKIAPTAGNFQALVYREPLGVVAQIIPWNFPILMMAWKIGPALAAGNTVVVKVAEQTPLTALRVGELALEAGIPKGVLNVLTGDGPVTGNAVASHLGVDKVAFTGSTEVGKIIMKHAAEGIKPVTLELGGKSPVVVCPDADIDEAVEIAHQALFFNMGQCCTAGSRTFVHSSIYDEFVKKATERAQNRTVGDPFSSDTEQGPQVSQEQFDKIMSLIQSGKDQGATLQTGGGRHGDSGYYVQPTVFSDVQDHFTIAKDEIFGPVQSILKWDTMGEVIERANNTEYGLAAGVVSNDENSINTLSRGLRAGTIWVNTWNQFDVGVPFGGYKTSGIGREHGEEVLSHYTQTKSVYLPLKEEHISWKI